MQAFFVSSATADGAFYPVTTQATAKKVMDMERGISSLYSSDMS
jgi:hypothetical protein